MKKSKNKNNSFKPSSIFLFTLIVSLFLALSLITFAQNEKIKKLQQEAGYISLDKKQKDLPACERDTAGTSTGGGEGQAIVSLEGNILKIEDHENSFKVCKNVKIYDVENGGQEDISVLKPGMKIWFETSTANFIKEIQVVSW